MQEYTLKKDNQVLSFNTYGAYVTGWQMHGTDIFYVGESIKRTGIPLLFPFAGPLENGILKYSGRSMPQHGFARDTTWNIKEQSDTLVKLSITQKDITPDMQEAYPYHFEANLILQLIDDGFSYKLRVKNNGHLPMPIASGIHPYFNVPHIQKPFITIDNSIFDGKAIDWNNIDKNSHFYPFTNHITINTDRYKVTIKDLNNVCTRLVVWSQDEQQDFVCIEPICKDFNAVNTDPIWVQRDVEWVMELQFLS
jgi:galactose mutarotase-like enzyme